MHRYLVLLALVVGACDDTSRVAISMPAAAASRGAVVKWNDGDSGRIDGVRFRLADWDAPETMPVGMRGGAKCENERLLGYAHRKAMEQLTGGALILETGRDPELDPFERVVMTLSMNGKYLGEQAAEAGIVKPYVFENGKATMPKPDWCK